MSECQAEVSPRGMEEQNLIRHMGVALMRARVDEPLTREQAYRIWAALAEEDREELRVNVRPLVPFVMQERARAEAAEAEAAELRDSKLAFAASNAATKALLESVPDLRAERDALVAKVEALELAGDGLVREAEAHCDDIWIPDRAGHAEAAWTAAKGEKA